MRNELTEEKPVGNEGRACEWTVHAGHGDFLWLRFNFADAPRSGLPVRGEPPGCMAPVAF